MIFRISLKEEELASVIKTGLFPKEYAGHIYAFFSEGSVSVINRFMEEYSVPPDTLKEYYFNFVKPFYANPDLEELPSGLIPVGIFWGPQLFDQPG